MDGYPSGPKDQGSTTMVCPQQQGNGPSPFSGAAPDADFPAHEWVSSILGIDGDLLGAGELCFQGAYWARCL